MEDLWEDFLCTKNSMINEIKMNYVDEDFFKCPFESLSKEARTADEIDECKSFELKDKVLYYNGRICVPEFDLSSTTQP